MTYVGIVGTRRRDTHDDFSAVQAAFIKFRRASGIPLKEFVIVSGGCEQGGDRFAEIIAGRLAIQKKIHYPDKTKLDPVLLKKNPRAAWAVVNYARNLLVARESEHGLIACVAADRTGGTENTIKEWKKLHPTDWKEKLVLV